MLLMAVLLANTGVIVVKHQCKMRGERIFLFGKPTDTCCSSIPTNQECSIEAPACCLEQTNIYKISSDFQLSSYSLTLALPQNILIPLFESKSIFLAYSPLSLACPHFPNPPPLPTGKALLPYLATFLI